MSIAATIEQFVYLGSKMELRVRGAGGAAFMLEQVNDGLHAGYAAGQSIHPTASAADLRAFPETGQV